VSDLRHTDPQHPDDQRTDRGASAPLAGRVALVTGAAQGMGAAHARRLAADGAAVAVNDLNDSPTLHALAEELGGVSVPGDVADPEQARAVVDAAAQALGGLDVLVANHAYMTMAPFLDHDREDWWKVIDTNLGGTFHLIQAALPHLRARGAGRIVVVSSEWGVTGWPGATAYAASKAGLVSLVKTLGRELAPQGIIVNAVAPGVTDTPQLEVDASDAGVSLQEVQQRYAKDIPLGRIARPDEMAAVVALLADFRISAMVGQVVQANGGTTRGRV
jgi:NAD(P)-dependent dehydrogenase (short-subunit alcohol dehydrogenase family)